MRSSLVLQKLQKAIAEDFTADMKEYEIADLKDEALSVIIMSVTHNILHEIVVETSATKA